jgi:thymidylate synthase ThyX
MAYSAKILKDSISPAGVRLTTMEVTFPRIILAEANTHRMIVKNSGSTRAIPTTKMIAKVLEDPFLPVYWGKNQPGMSAREEISPENKVVAKEIWLSARDSMVEHVNRLLEVGVHKQLAGRLLEPFAWQTCIFTATEWANFFNLRTHKDAQPEIQKIAVMMKELYQNNVPELNSGWHLPLTDDIEELSKSFSKDEICWISIGRCARVSYLTHLGIRDPKADLELAKSLKESGHMSPFEHIAVPLNIPKANKRFSGPLRGWFPYRKTFPDEAVYIPRN